VHGVSLAHRFAPELDTVRIVHHTVKDRVGQSGVADGAVPLVGSWLTTAVET